MTTVDFSGPQANSSEPFAKPLPKLPLKTHHFEVLGLAPELLKAIGRAGYTEPTPIQTRAIPVVLAGKDLIGQAQTGSGKTAAYLLPALQNIGNTKSVSSLILVPTRELAEQVLQEVRTLGQFSNVKAVSIIGGQPYARQIDLVRKGAHIVVATPGRLLDHLRAGVFKQFRPGYVVLDEADEMLDMGFIEDIKSILKFLPKERQTLLFSATMPKPIEKLAREELQNPEYVRLIPKGELQAHIEQKLYVVNEYEREDAIIRLIDFEQPAKAVVFCRRRLDTESLADKLFQRGLSVKTIHGDLAQNVRLRAMKDIKEGRIQILLATDVASRGLDITDLTHVFNYHIPDNVDRFTHRIGRTGRAGKTGVAVTLTTPKEVMGHPFFKEYPLVKFKLEPVPGIKALEDKMNEELIKKIKAAPYSKRSDSLVRDLSTKEEMKDVIGRMFSLLESRSPMEGPDSLGLDPKEVRSLGAGRRSFQKKSFSRGRPGGGGGRSSDRPAGRPKSKSSGSPSRESFRARKKKQR